MEARKLIEEGRAALAAMDISGARRCFRQAVALYEQAGDEGRQELAAAYEWLGWACLQSGDHAQAEDAYEQGLSVLAELHGERSPEVAEGRNRFGVALHRQKLYDWALDEFLAARNLAADLTPPGSKSYPAICLNALRAAHAAGDPEDVLLTAPEALRTNCPEEGDAPEIAQEVLNIWAVALHKLGRCEEALPLYERAAKEAETAFGDFSDHTRQLRSNVQVCKRALGLEQ